MDDEAKSKTFKKISKVFGIVTSTIMIVCIVFLLYATISYSKTGLVNFFGYSFHTIQSPSMEPDIKVGDLVIVKKVPYSEIDVGDDILFKCEDTTSAVYGKYVVHRVIEKTDTEGVYRTQGVNNPGPDLVPSKAEGKVIKVSSSLSGLFNFVTQGRNILFIVAIFGVIIFGFMQLCSVIANSAKIKAEAEKEKVVTDEELKEKIKRELEAELASENQSSDGKDSDIGGDTP